MASSTICAALPISPEEEPESRITRRTVLGVIAASAVVAACDAPGTASSDTTADTVVRPEEGRFPESLPLVDETTTTTKPGESTTSTTAKSDPKDSTTSTTAKPGTATTKPTAQTTTKGGTKTTSVATTAVATTLAQSTLAPTTLGPTTTSGLATTSTTATPVTPSTNAPPTFPSTTTPATTTPPTAPPTTAAPPPPPPEASVLLLANRATFGTTPEVESEITRLGIAGWVDQQLSWTAPDPAIEGLMNEFRTLDSSRQQAYAISQEDNNPIRRELVHSCVIRSRYSRYQLFEMMCHLWTDHFNINITSGRWRHLHIDYQENVIRANALGRFEDLLRATAGSPGMLVYLDNAFSNANSSKGVNENYGRELLELHTLGIDANGNQIYTEADVRAASLIMSGWSVVTDRDASNFSDFLYRDNFHSSDTATILNGAFSSAGFDGQSAGEALITFLAHHPTTARHIAYKLIRRFVTDTPPESLVASAAQVFLASDTALAPTLRHILLSAEFATSAGQKMRRPFELTVASLRALGTNVPVDPYGQAADTMRYRLGDLNHEPWSWEQPDGFADEAGPWLSSDGLLERWAFTSRAANNFLSNQNNPGPIRTDLLSLRGNASTVGELVSSFQDRFGITALTAAHQASMLGVLGVNGSDPIDVLTEENLGELASFLMAHPQYQTR